MLCCLNTSASSVSPHTEPWPASHPCIHECLLSTICCSHSTGRPAVVKSLAETIEAESVEGCNLFMVLNEEASRLPELKDEPRNTNIRHLTVRIQYRRVFSLTQLISETPTVRNCWQSLPFGVKALRIEYITNATAYADIATTSYCRRYYRYDSRQTTLCIASRTPPCSFGLLPPRTDRVFHTDKSGNRVSHSRQTNWTPRFVQWPDRPNGWL